MWFGFVAEPLVAQSQEAPNSSVRRVLWRDPGAIADRDLSWKSVPSLTPPAPPFVFVSEDMSGTTPKIVVTDANGTEWNVKLSVSADDAGEVHAEVAAARLVWALGYFVDESYFVPEGTIENLGELRRAQRAFGSDGHLEVARFEKRSKDLERADERWTIAGNPFTGNQELSGLKILMTMINSWDLGGTRNLRIVQVLKDGEEPELRYLVSDLGASFGRMDRTALFNTRSKWNLADFQKQKFIDGVRNRSLDLHYAGDGEINLVPLDHARWFARLAGQLTPEQIAQAFESAGASPAEVKGYQQKLLDKIAELKAVIALLPAETAQRD
jgi:hypothetical protein